jgi:ATP-binding cassette, subfamily C, bacterial CydD
VMPTHCRFFNAQNLTDWMVSGTIEIMNPNSRLIRIARQAGVYLPLAILCGLLTGGLVVLQAYLLSQVINGVFLEDQTLPQLVPILRIILLVALGRVIFTILNEWLGGWLAIKVKTDLREALLNKINRLGPAFTRNERTAELTTSAVQGLDALDAYFSQYLPQILLAAILPVIILFVVFPLDLLTGIVFVLTAPLIPLFMILIGKYSETHTKRQWLGLTRLGAFFLDSLQGLTALKILGRNRDRIKELDDASEKYRRVTMNVLRITFLSAFVLEMIATISTAVVAVEIGLRLLYSRMEFQQAFFILLIAPEFYLPLRNLSVRYHAGMTGLTASRRIFELLDAPEKASVFSVTKTSTENPFEGTYTIQLKDVSFTYPGAGNKALEKINLTLESAKHYALVGKSGAGKSTLAQLLLRFVEPETGIIVINGVDIRCWAPEVWRNWIGWVPQKPALFNTTLLENIRLHDPKITEEQINCILEPMLLDGLVKEMLGGVNTQLLECGIRLSGGEAQRVALARVFIRQRPFFMMDEPTAHLDYETEQLLSETIERLRHGQTSLTIAHRLTTITKAGHIFVLDKGKLVQQGTHQELSKHGGIYQNLIFARGGSE